MKCSNVSVEVKLSLLNCLISLERLIIFKVAYVGQWLNGNLIHQGMITMLNRY